MASSEVQSHTVERVLGIPLKIGVGYGLPWPEVPPFVPEGRVCFGTGAGGALVLADVDRRLTVAYVMNNSPLKKGTGLLEVVSVSGTQMARRTESFCGVEN
jgi:hypothetical protein